MTTEELYQAGDGYAESYIGTDASYEDVRDCYQYAYKQALKDVAANMASVVTEDFNKTASIFQLDGLIASNRNYFLKPFQELLP